MTSSIEKAAQRLEQLRKAGAVLPGDKPRVQNPGVPDESQPLNHVPQFAAPAADGDHAAPELRGGFENRAA